MKKQLLEATFLAGLNSQILKTCPTRQCHRDPLRCPAASGPGNLGIGGVAVLWFNFAAFRGCAHFAFCTRLHVGFWLLNQIFERHAVALRELARLAPRFIQGARVNALYGAINFPAQCDEFFFGQI